MSITAPIICFHRVSKHYSRGRQQIEVLQDLTLDVAQGTFLALMGPSGSGKTTLLNLVGGLDAPSSGTLTSAGVDINRLSSRELAHWRACHIGFVFQFYNLMPMLSAERNVELPLLLTSLSGPERRHRVASALELVSASSQAKQKPYELSGGQQQRIAIARALVTDPVLLLCDEPTGDLDRPSAEEILRLLQLLNRDHGKTILMVTHDRRAADHAGQILLLDKGQIARLDARADR